MKILIVSPFFPPDLSVATVRISSLTRYLIRKGINITILTNESNSTDVFDSEDKFITDNVDIKEVKFEKNTRKFLKRKKAYEIYMRRMLKEESYDLVLITAGPFYTLSLPKIVKKEYSTPVIVDFRDLWIFDIREIREFFKPKSILKKLIFYPIEANAIKYSDKVITVTEGWAKILKNQYPLYRDKIEVIYNGYDSEKFKNVFQSEQNLEINNAKDDDFIKIMNFGKLSYYSEKYSYLFFEAVNELVDDKLEVKVTQIGELEKRTSHIIEEIEISEQYFTNTGFITYEEGISILSSSNAFLIIDIRKNALGTKIYDYIALNKPIIYVGRKNTDLSNFVKSFENGFVCTTKEEIKNAIKIIEKEQLENLTESNQKVKYSRDNQNSSFFKIIQEIYT